MDHMTLDGSNLKAQESDWFVQRCRFLEKTNGAYWNSHHPLKDLVFFVCVFFHSSWTVAHRKSNDVFFEGVLFHWERNIFTSKARAGGACVFVCVCAFTRKRKTLSVYGGDRQRTKEMKWVFFVSGASSVGCILKNWSQLVMSITYTWANYSDLP